LEKIGVTLWTALNGLRLGSKNAICEESYEFLGGFLKQGKSMGLEKNIKQETFNFLNIFYRL
jgi:hypothetical protein